MSLGVQSRPNTQGSVTGRMPQVQHPLASMPSNGVLDLDIQGLGDTTLGRAASVMSQSGRPLSNENSFSSSPRKPIGSVRVSRSNRHMEQMRDQLLFQSIPENVAVTAGDQTKTRLPIFGNYKFSLLVSSLYLLKAPDKSKF